MVKIFFFIFLFVTQVFTKEFAFLPTYVIGQVPVFISQKDDPSDGISELLAFYAREKYQMEITDPDSLRNYLESLNGELNRKPSRYLVNGVCSELEPDFLVHNEIDFDGRGNIISEIYNCKGKLLYRRESILDEDFYFSIENHSRLLFSFLNPKTIAKVQNEEEEFLIALDTSGSISGDARSLLDYIEETAGIKKIGLLVLKKNSYSYLRPTLNVKKIISTIKEIKFSGEISLEEIGSSLLRATNELAYSSSSKKKLILLSDARIGKGDAYKFITSIQSLAQLNYEIHILGGSYYDHKDASIYTKAVNASGGKLHLITHSQILGTKEGYKSIFLHDRKIYYVNEKILSIQKFNTNQAFKINESQVYSEVDFPHPNNMGEVFLKITNQKAIEYGKINSNIREITDSLIQGSSNSILQNFSRVLIKSGANTIWLKLKNVDEKWIGEEAVFRVKLKKDKYSALGFSNIPEESFYYKDSYPLLLLLSNLEIKNLLEKSQSNTLDCFFRGKVLEIKN